MIISANKLDEYISSQLLRFCTMICMFQFIIGEVDREYHIRSCLLISSLSRETRNSAGTARLAEPVRRVSGRA